ncbi:MAG: TM0996/MTH895 family glutaredoxin-like protein [Bacteroidales bacterium]|nr:TM0996/MTH895 family glutaredoxin-like protein [Bacteroidales bacterium]
MEIKVLGPGCMKCKNMEKVVRETVEQNNIDAQISKVEDIMEIMTYGVMTTPALVVDGRVVIKGYIPSKDEVLRVLTQ